MSFPYVFSREKDPRKRQWEMDLLDDDDVCCFGDCTELSSGNCHCFKHDKKCVARFANGVIAGTSCKDLSRANPGRGKSSGPVMAGGDSPGGSANIFYGLIGWVDKNVPDWAIVENSDAMLDGDRGNFDIMVSEFTSRGDGINTQAYTEINETKRLRSPSLPGRVHRIRCPSEAEAPLPCRSSCSLSYHVRQ